MSRTKNSEIILRIKGKRALIKYYRQVIKRPRTKWIAANIYLFEGWLNEAEGELLQLQNSV